MPEYQQSFNLAHALEVWRSTPATVRAMLEPLGPHWTEAREHDGGWSPREVVAHLIVGEKTDWLPRTLYFVEQKAGAFPPFDMEAHLPYAKQHSLDDLLDEFRSRRQANVVKIQALNLTDEQLELTSTHPALSTVKLKQHLAAWAAHDMSHIAQLARIIAKQYKDATGPWAQFLSVLKR